MTKKERRKLRAIGCGHFRNALQRYESKELELMLELAKLKVIAQNYPTCYWDKRYKCTDCQGICKDGGEQ